MYQQQAASRMQHGHECCQLMGIVVSLAQVWQLFSRCIVVSDLKEGASSCPTASEKVPGLKRNLGHSLMQADPLPQKLQVLGSACGLRKSCTACGSVMIGDRQPPKKMAISRQLPAEQLVYTTFYVIGPTRSRCFHRCLVHSCEWSLPFCQ